MTTPTVSILMAAFNAASYIDASIQSVRDQDFQDWELIVVDDGSRDETAHILSRHEADDPRIHRILNEENVGLPTSLNRAIKIARGRYIARLDADDIALPDRLTRQIAFLNANRDHVMVGANTYRIDKTDAVIGRTEMPTSDAAIRARFLFENPFIHPTMMMRADLFTDPSIRYDESFETTQDWALWLACLDHGRVANLRDPVIWQRVHDGSISSTKRSLQLKNSLRIQRAYVTKLLGEDFWDESLFKAINESFLVSRKASDLGGHGRVTTASRVLAFADRAKVRLPSDIADALETFVVERAITMGIGPPFPARWPHLALNLLMHHPKAAVKAATRILRRSAILRPPTNAAEPVTRSAATHPE